jgi:PAS domain S-box-containing protein
MNAGDTGRNKQWRLLIVGKDRNLATRLLKVLEPMDCELAFAFTGKGAHQALPKFNADAVMLTDRLNDEVMDLIESLRRDFPSIVIIVMAALADSKDAISTMQAGANYYLPRPAHLSELEPFLEQCFERLAVERKRDELEEELIEAEEAFRTLVETAPVPAFTMEADGTIRTVNAAFEDVLGWPAADWRGRQFADLAADEDADAVRQMLADCAQGERPEPTRVSFRSVSGEESLLFSPAPQQHDSEVSGIVATAQPPAEQGGEGRAALAELESRQEVLLAERDNARQSLEETQQELQELEERHEDTRESLKEAERRYSELVAEREAAGDALADSEKRHQELVEERDRAQQALAQAQRRLEDLSRTPGCAGIRHRSGKPVPGARGGTPTRRTATDRSTRAGGVPPHREAAPAGVPPAATGARGSPEGRTRPRPGNAGR